MKLYVLIRNDLPKSYQAVQAGHAVAEYLIKNPQTSWDNGTLVYLRVRDEETLKGYEQKFDNFVGFREPDLGNELTALAGLGFNTFPELRCF